MQDTLDESGIKLQAYNPNWLKKKLKNHFGEDIFFIELGRGKGEVVSLRRNASEPLHELSLSTKEADEARHKTNNQDSIKLIFNDTKNMSSEKFEYPDLKMVAVLTIRSTSFQIPSKHS